MIRHSQTEVDIFNVYTSAAHVDAAADHAGVGASQVAGEYVALVPFKLGLLRYTAAVEDGAA